MLGLIDALLEQQGAAKAATTASGEVGRFITLAGGRVIFIADSSVDSELPDKPKVLSSERSIVMMKKKDGSEEPRTVYSDSWLRRSSEHKFRKVAHILRNAPKIEQNLRDSLGGGYGPDGALTGEGVTAACALAVTLSGMRIGSPGQGTRDKGVALDHFKKTGNKKFFRTFGSTTLQRKHAKVSGDTVTFRYVGKSGVKRVVKVKDAELAEAVSSLLDSPGKPSGSLWDNGSGRVTAQRLGKRFKRINPQYDSKDMRTTKAMMVGSKEVARVLAGRKKKIPSDPKKARAMAKALIKKLGVVVSAQLGNTPAVAIKDYTNPMLVEHMLRGYGFSDGLLEDQATVEAMKAASTPIDMSAMPVLMALFGEDEMRKWASAAVSASDDQ